ncbi:MAG: S41 family peptidase [Armatimonadetes bacterium]|nr:S41 family peptidase [Armatimonadota bacterium]
MRRATRIAIGIGILSSAFVLGFGWPDLAHGGLPRLGLIPAAVGLAGDGDDLHPTRAFADALANIDAFFYGTSDRQEMTHEAIQGMLRTLGDAYTELWKPEDARRFLERNRGQFVGSAGIGAELRSDPIRGPVVRVRIVRVFKDSPADESGVRANDRIVKVNGDDVVGRELLEIVDQIRGEAGTRVELTLYREATGETFTKIITRRMVQIQDVYGEIVMGAYLEGLPPIGRLHVRSFSETVPAQFDEELAALEAQGIRGLVIDMRGNPGGIMSSAVDLCARFVDGKLITTVKGRRGSPERYRARSGVARPHSYPIVILVDRYSASAAEIFAGAMQDYEAATIVGERTYGKAAVQKVEKLPDGALVKFTIARYYLPRGTGPLDSIERVEDAQGKQIGGGIQPDIVLDPEELMPSSEDPDPFLRRAVEVILEKIGESLRQEERAAAANSERDALVARLFLDSFPTGPYICNAVSRSAGPAA